MGGRWLRHPKDRHGLSGRPEPRLVGQGSIPLRSSAASSPLSVENSARVVGAVAGVVAGVVGWVLSWVWGPDRMDLREMPHPTIHRREEEES